MRIFQAMVAAFVLALATGAAHAEPTEIMVRAISRDAKFIGSSMGGVAVILRDAETGEVLGQGVTEGATGDTIRVMQGQGRRATLASADAAAFRVTLDIDRPRLIEAELFGPLAQRQAAVRVSAQQWVLPGRHIRDGNGWMIELPGFVVDVLDPPAHRALPGGTRSVEVRANIMMMCGCPTQPGGLWDADRYELRASARRNGTELGEVALTYAGASSQYVARIETGLPGTYDVLVSAYDPLTGNTGVDRTTFTIASP